MARAGRRSGLVLLCCATLLLISTSAVSGVLDENVREFGRFAGRMDRQHLEKILERMNRVDGGDHHLHPDLAVVAEEGPKVLESDAETKPAEGFLEKARSFLSGVFGNGIPNPADFVPSERKWEEAASSGRRHFGRPRGSGPSHWNRVRDLVRHHPGGIAAAVSESAEPVISSTEPLALEEDVTPESPLQAKIAGIVSTVLQEFNEGAVKPDSASTCVGSLAVEVKDLVKRVKSALREQLCNGDVDSTEEQAFCNLFHSVATWDVLSRTDVNPVFVAWRKISGTAVCSSAEPHTDFLDSLTVMEGLARQYDALEDNHMEREPEHSFFHGHRREHGDHHRHWWHRLLHKHRDMKPHHVEEGPHERDVKPHHVEEGPHERDMKPHHVEEGPHERNEGHRWHHGPKTEGELGFHGHEHIGHERRWWHHEPKEMGPHGHEDEGHVMGPHRHEDEGHEKHWWHRVLGMFHDHKHTRHHGFERAHGNDCLSRNVRHFARGIKEHMVTTCRTATDESVITACKFADQHRFLVKAWIAVKVPLWRKAAMSCEQPIVSSAGSLDGEVRHAPNLGIDHVERVGHPFAREDSVVNMNEPQLNHVPHNLASKNADLRKLQFSKRCAGHHASKELRKVMRGMEISSSNSGETVVPRGPLRTRIVVLRGLPLHHFQEAFDNSHILEHSLSLEMISELQDRLAELVKESEIVREAEKAEHQAEPVFETAMMTSQPIHHHVNGLKWRRPHFRISANPNRAMPMSEGRHFRISAMPREVGESDNEAPRFAVPVVVHETDATVIDGTDDVQLQDKTAKHTAENRASM